MNFKQYLAESEKTYKFRIKTVAELEKTHHQMIQDYLARFNLIKMLPAKKTILQRNPMDFGPEIQNHQVTMLDVEMGLPISSFILEKELTSLLRLPQGYLLVRGEHDALEDQVDKMSQASQIAQEADKKGLHASTLMSTDSEYQDAEKTPDGKNYYGNEYNGRFLKYLKAESVKKEEATKIEPAAPLFTWLDYEKLDHTPDDNQAFNASMDQTPDTKVDSEALLPGTHGEFTGVNKTVKKDFVNKSGDHKTLKGKTNPIGGKK